MEQMSSVSWGSREHNLHSSNLSDALCVQLQRVLLHLSALRYYSSASDKQKPFSLNENISDKNEKPEQRVISIPMINMNNANLSRVCSHTFDDLH